MAKNRSRFIGEVAVRWLEDGRSMQLLEDFVFIDKKGRKWKAGSGAVVDGASIPRILWSTVGSPFVGNYRRASVLHDVACQERKRSWKKVHRMFYDAMLADNTPKAKARQMYKAVLLFGPRWDKTGKTLPPQLNDNELYL